MKKDIIKLSNGLLVANFSSPHEFKFEDGSILPAHDNEYSLKYQITFIETLLSDNTLLAIKDEINDVFLRFELSNDVMELVHYWNNMSSVGNVHRVLIPMPMMTALREKMSMGWIRNSPFRVIRVEDRINKLISISKFCI